MKFLLTVLGVVAVFEGIPLFLSPSGVKRALLQLIVTPNRVLRWVGLCFMVTGLVLVWFATRTG